MMAKLLPSTRVLCTGILVVVLSFGCSESKPPAGSISGKIMHNGEPFSDCRVAVYHPETFLTLGSNVDGNGAFDIQAVPPGEYIVTVLPPPSDDSDNMSSPEASAPIDIDKNPIPKSMRHKKTSELRVTVNVDETSNLSFDIGG